MAEEMEMLVFEGEDGEEISFYVVEETIVAGVKYLLVTDSDEDEADAYILKETSEEGEDEISFIFVEDEKEIEAISKIFEQLLDDVSFEVES